MTKPTYAHPIGGMPPQSQLMGGRAVFTEAYAVIPHGVQREIVTSFLPHWEGAKFWVLARPLSGFAETFSQYAAEVAPGGGTTRPEAEPGVQSALFLTHGAALLQTGGESHLLVPGSFVWVPPGQPWELKSEGEDTARFQWFRKRYIAVEGIEVPAFFHLNDQDLPPEPMPYEDTGWFTTRFMPPEALGFDMHITVVTLMPGTSIPFLETHVMEHGLYVLQGKGVYQLNRDRVEVEAGDFMWLRAFCPQACYAGGKEPFRYLLYKDVNRHAALPRVPLIET